jgi:DNA (cytosine-5)-methyltransferase 1
MRHGSLFSGIGGFDLAAEWVGWENVFHCEIDKYNRSILKKNFPVAISIKDVRDIYRFTNEYNDLYEDGEVMWCDRHDKDFADCECIGCSQWEDEIGEIDILTGGFPCVDITNAKNAIEKPKGIYGEESGLWFEFQRVISLLRPRWTVVENSSNINVRGLSEVVGGLTELRYDSIWFTVPASRVGAPHRRNRTFIISHSNQQGLEGDVCKKLAGEIKRRFDTNTCRSTWWDSEPRLDRVVNGLPARVDKKRERLHGLGNSVVPFVALEIFKSIQNYEDNHHHLNSPATD